MLTIAFAALITVAPALQFTPRPVAHLGAISFAPAMAVIDTPLEHIEKGRTALVAGDLATAEREFAKAIRMQRADGVLSVDASYGAAQVHMLQKRFREAADLLDQLAADANLLGDAETEARVLLDVVSIKVNGHRSAAARLDADRLKQLVSDVRVSDTTRRLIKVRLA
jgi:tetratricopeptide (TPR) repeat protein